MIEDKIRIEALHKDIESFMEDIKRLQIKNAKLYENIITLEKYKEKCIQAIEYIKEKDLTNNANFMDDGVGYLFEDLLEILGDKE